MSESLFRAVSEQMVRLVRTGVYQKAVLIHPGDQFEVKATPSVLLVGPTVTENRHRRTLARWYEPVEPEVEGDPPTCRVHQHPRLYNLDFEIVITAATGAELLEFMERVAAFWSTNTEMSIANVGSFGLTELEPLGGYHRVNLSNLRQASGKFRIEDVPAISEAATIEAFTVLTRTFQYRDGVTVDRTFGPEN